MKSNLLCLFMLIFNYSFAQNNLIDSFAKLKNTEERIKFLSNDNVISLGKNGCYIAARQLKRTFKRDSENLYEWKKENFIDVKILKYQIQAYRNQQYKF
jgi:hypothetical protein